MTKQSLALLTSDTMHELNDTATTVDKIHSLHVTDEYHDSLPLTNSFIDHITITDDLTFCDLHEPPPLTIPVPKCTTKPFLQHCANDHIDLLNERIDQIYTSPIMPAQLWPSPRLIQSDRGTNCSVTNVFSLLHNPRSIPPKHIGGIGGRITCTAEGGL